MIGMGLDIGPDIWPDRQAQPLLFYTAFAVLGLILGSFASAMAYRIPRLHDWFLEEVGEKRKPYLTSYSAAFLQRSKCTNCDMALGARDLIPLFSWLLTRGKCRYCQSPISVRYPLLELGCLAVAMLIAWQVEHAFLSALLIIGLPFAAASLLVDLETLILPDEFTLALGFLGLLYAAEQSFFKGFLLTPWSDYTQFILCGLVYGFLGWLLQFSFWKLTGKEGLGWGDIKFFVVAGIWMGWFLMPIYLIIACVIGGGVGLVYKAMHKQVLFPFGPALIIALYITMIFRVELEALVY